MTIAAEPPPRPGPAPSRPDPDVGHIPGRRPLVPGAHTVRFAHDPFGFIQTLAARHGPVFKTYTLGRPHVTLQGADALEFVLMDHDGVFSSREGWHAIERLFSGGLMLRDFDEHRRHRRVMQAAFTAPAMRAHAARLSVEVERIVAGWPDDRPVRLHDAAKDATLRIGAAVFMGLDVDDPEAGAINRALMAEVDAALAPIRRPLPMTRMRRGVRAREALSARLRAMIAERRGRGGQDFFSRMCLAADDDGRAWSDDEIVDHFNFLLMAAHDTTASTLTALVWALSEHSEWQERVAAEADGLARPLGEPTPAAMPLTDRVLREALRLVPPVPFVPRRAARAFEWGGHRVPAGALVSVSPGLVMRSPEHWSDPDAFDPDRFSPERAEDRSHRFAWAPFGGGAHKCIGMHFATMQVKLFAAALFAARRVVPAGRGPVRWSMVPIPKPRGGLPVRLPRRG